MKKILWIGAMVAGSILAAGSAGADYDAKTRQAIMDEMNRFYQAEQGNRLTPYSMRSLIQDIDKAFQGHVVKPATTPVEKLKE